MAASTPALKPIDPAALQATIEGLAKELMLPGAMVLLTTPQGNVIFGYGTTELGTTNPPRADTHFRAASNTKTMTAAVIVQMVQEGKLELRRSDLEIRRRRPQRRRDHDGQLMNMRSGLFNFTNAPELAESLDEDPDKVWTADEVLGMAFKRPPDFAPGAEYEYNNTNYYLLGLVAEKIDGKPLSAVFQDRLFGPLGMKNTVLPPSTSNAIPEPYTHGYLYGSTSYALADAPYPEDLRRRPRRERSSPTTTPGRTRPPTLRPAASSRPPTTSRPGCARWSGASSSMPISSSSGWRAPSAGARQACDAEIRLRHPDAHLRAQRIYYHEGEMPGYQSFMGYDPANDVTLVIWTNLTLALDGKATANTLMVKILDQIYTVSPLQAK